MNRQQKIDLILAAYNFNADMRAVASCNSLYMGSMATYSLHRALGAGPPHETSLAEALAHATDAQLDAGLKVCENIIQHMEKNPKHDRNREAARAEQTPQGDRRGSRMV